MTTLRDLLNDFAQDVKRIPAEISTESGEKPWDHDKLYEEALDEKIEEYIEAICKRWVGQE